MSIEPILYWPVLQKDTQNLSQGALHSSSFGLTVKSPSKRKLTWSSVGADVVDGQLLVLDDLLFVGHDHLAAGHHQVVAASLGFVDNLIS